MGDRRRFEAAAGGRCDTQVSKDGADRMSAQGRRTVNCTSVFTQRASPGHKTRPRRGKNTPPSSHTAFPYPYHTLNHSLSTLIHTPYHSLTPTPPPSLPLLSKIFQDEKFPRWRHAAAPRAQEVGRANGGARTPGSYIPGTPSRPWHVCLYTLLSWNYVLNDYFPNERLYSVVL